VTQLTLPGTTTATPTALTVDPGVDFDTWLAAGGRLLGAASSINWWVGDWILHGEAQWGGTDGGMAMLRREICAVTNLDPQTLERVRHIASSVPPQVRREGLSWSHHVEVAALPLDAQAELLEAAEAGDVDAVSGESRRWPVERLRREVRRLRDLEAGDPLPGLPAPSRPLRVMVPRETVAAALPALVDAVKVLPAGEGRAAVMALVELLEKEATS
jgi:hypothetical protein